MPDTAEIRKFNAPEIIFGPGAFELLGSSAAQYRAERALLVTDAGVRRSGWAARAEELLRSQQVDFVVYEREQFQPKDQEIMTGVDDYLRRRCSQIIAVGGGSVLDCAKGICAVVGNGRHILSLSGGDQPILPGPPLICAPTTPGSGAEVSQFVVLVDSRRQVKLTAVGRALSPGLTLVDPHTAATLSSEALAHSILDALGHAVEAYVSTAGSALSDVHALEALRILARLVSAGLPDPHDPHHRLAVCLGGLHAGLALSNAGLGLAHAISHASETLTGLPHPLCLSWALPVAVRYNYAAASDRYNVIAGVFRQALDEHPVGAAIHGGDSARDSCGGLPSALQEIITRLRLDPHRVQAALPVDGYAQVAANALSDVMAATNPIIPTPGELEGWLAQNILS